MERDGTQHFFWDKLFGHYQGGSYDFEIRVSQNTQKYEQKVI